MGESRIVPNADYLNPDALADLCCQKTGGKKTSNSKGGFQVRCPAHEDRNASLSINQGGKGTVCHCHAGCTSEQVMTAVGLKVANLFFSAQVGSTPKEQVSVLRIKKNTDDTDCTAYTDYTVTNTLLEGMPQIARPRRHDNEDSIYRALFHLIRWLALDRGLRRDPDVIPDEARKVIEAWRVEFAEKENVMEFKEEVASRWHSAKVKIADGHIQTALRKAEEKIPLTCPDAYKGSEHELLFGICYYLAEEEADGIFIVPVRDIEVALKLKHPMQATRKLRVLMMDEIITKRPEFRVNTFSNADRFQLNADYSSDPERKNRISVASWHRFTKSQIINMAPPIEAVKGLVEEIKRRHSLTFDTEDFCRRGEAAHWKTDYGNAFERADFEKVALSFVETTKPDKSKE